MPETLLEEGRLIQITRQWSKAHPIIEAFITGAVIDFHDAEDLVSEVAETVVMKFNDYDPSRPFVPWAMGIARNLLLRYFERKAADAVGSLMTIFSMSWSRPMWRLPMKSPPAWQLCGSVWN